MSLELDNWLCTSLNPSLLLKGTFRVSVSYPDPSGMEQKEYFRKNFTFSMSILSISYSLLNVRIYKSCLSFPG